MNYKIIAIAERIIWFVFYLILEHIFSIEVYFDDAVKSIIATMLSPILCVLIGEMIFKIAYGLTGSIHSTYDPPIIKSITHWKIRSILFIIIILLEKIGLWKLLLIPLVNLISAILIEGNDTFSKWLTDKLLEPWITK